MDVPLTTRKLRIFALVAELGSISRAAARLRTAQPVISRAVSSLERDLGVRLCERLAKGVSLTEAGALLAREARDIIARLDELESRILEEVSNPTGRINVALPPALAPLLVPELIPRFRLELPRTIPVLHEINSSEAWTLVQSGALDLAVLTSLEPDLDIDMEFLANEPVCLIGRNSPQLAAKREVDLAFVASQPLILTSRPHVLRRMLDSQFARLGLRPQILAEANSLLSIRMAICGHGYTIYPRSTTHTFKGEPSLAVIPISGMRVTWTIAYSKSRTLTRPARVFARLIRDVTAEMIERGEWEAVLIS
jgi:LysR family nitrogen assimilation transcriptional regulator